MQISINKMFAMKASAYNILNLHKTNIIINNAPKKRIKTNVNYKHAHSFL